MKKRYLQPLIAIASLLLAVLISIFIQGQYDKKIRWAIALQPEEIAAISVRVSPADPAKCYRELQSEEFAAVAGLLDNAKGRHLRNPEALAGGGITYYITTKDGVRHIVSNLGNEYLYIDGNTYDAEYHWLSAWEIPKTNAPAPDWLT